MSIHHLLGFLLTPTPVKYRKMKRYTILVGVRLPKLSAAQCELYSFLRVYGVGLYL